MHRVKLDHALGDRHILLPRRLIEENLSDLEIHLSLVGARPHRSEHLLEAVACGDLWRGDPLGVVLIHDLSLTLVIQLILRHDRLTLIERLAGRRAPPTLLNSRHGDVLQGFCPKV